jgi:hypothetical protein
MFALTQSLILGTTPVASESWCVGSLAAGYCGKRLELRLDSAKPTHENPISIRNFAGANQEMGT